VTTRPVAGSAPSRSSNSHMPSKRSSHARVPELDGLRGIAIAAVILYHYTGASTRLARVTGAQFGYLGVTLFFVLSGYLITGILLSMRPRSDYFRAFYGRRALRIFPPYYVVLVLGLSLAILLRGPQPIWNWLTCFLYLSANFHVAKSPAIPFAIYTGLAVTWSLSVEEQFYIVWAPLVRWVKDNHLVPALCFIIALGPLLRWGLGLDPALHVIGSIACFDYLAFGSLTCIAIRRWNPTLLQSRVLLAASMAAFLAIICGGGFSPIGKHNPLNGSVAALAFASLLGYVVLREGGQGGLCRALRTRPLLELGKVSYTLYLIHQPVAAFVDNLARDFMPMSHTLERMAARPVALVLSFLLAEASWHYFEAPMMRLKDRLFPRGHTATTSKRIAGEYAPAQMGLVRQ
jgi:peptidoglycan/LPS O-acetylase OafA/YrhL